MTTCPLRQAQAIHGKMNDLRDDQGRSPESVQVHEKSDPQTAGTEKIRFSQRPLEEEDAALLEKQNQYDYDAIERMDELDQDSAQREKINQRNAKIHDLTREKKLLAQKLVDKETTADQTKSELERALAANERLKKENDELKAENAGLKEENELLGILLKDVLPTSVGRMRQRELGNSSGNSSDMRMSTSEAHPPPQKRMRSATPSPPPPPRSDEESSGNNLAC